MLDKGAGAAGAPMSGRAIGGAVVGVEADANCMKGMGRRATRRPVQMASGSWVGTADGERAAATGMFAVAVAMIGTG
ncbi:hypothetical protein PAN31108_01353 [Pandoraea anhela]|uniref:Uncharacterized protein n=1 Tax=Pandoraea anhela TaxID=2508295 RepID=A0A5E4TD77_9BURK|nr:hypothetical protein PAN31108_01353 [Pandoraea anhela]